MILIRNDYLVVRGHLVCNTTKGYRYKTDSEITRHGVWIVDDCNTRIHLSNTAIRKFFKKVLD